MQVITKEEFGLSKRRLFERIAEGAIFIHPTDTIYGIGCNATDSVAVRKVRVIKGRPTAPFSVIAPSKEWILQNCTVTVDAKRWIGKLPGPYTLILRKKDTNIDEEVAPGIDTIGVRIPEHWFSDVVKELGFPVVTTSANVVNEDFMTSLEDLNPVIEKQIEFILYEGSKDGSPSKIVDLSGKIRITER